jgi:protocatechuate 3,4-dioxygenase beta subunit
MLAPNRKRRVASLILAAWAASATFPVVAQENPGTTMVEVAGTVVDAEGKPIGGAMVNSEGYPWDLRVAALGRQTRTGPDGNFSIPVRETFEWTGRITVDLLARVEDGRLGSISLGLKSLTPVRIVVKAPRTIIASVVDGADKPVAGAEFIAFADRMTIFRGQTGADGNVSFGLPEDAASWTLSSLKSKIGFDYVNNFKSFHAGGPLDRMPDRITLKLDGVRPPLKVRAVDPRGKPLAGLTVYPGSFWMTGSRVFASTHFLGRTRTDREGVAVFDWLPRGISRDLTVDSLSMDFYQEKSVRIPAETPVDEVMLVYTHSGRLSGRILSPDGRPASGVRVMAQGRFDGTSNFRFPAQAVTGDDGRYSMRVAVDNAYILWAGRGYLVTPYHSGLIVRPDGPAQAPDLTLQPGTMLRGRVTRGNNLTPLVNSAVGVGIDLGKLPAELGVENQETAHRMTVSLSDRTDEAGRYHILLAPGKYDLRGPGNLPIETIAIPADNPPAEFLRDYNLP